MKGVIIYNGAEMCCKKDCCPIITHDKKAGTITIKDPAKPENGSFSMSVEEYNLIVRNAKPIK